MKRLAPIAVASAIAVLATWGISYANAAGASENLFGSTVPVVKADSDSSAVTVGVKFTTKAAGSVTGVRFYKGAGNSGVHVGGLYNQTGGIIARNNFKNETSSGWQTLTFATAIPVKANQTYTAAVFDPAGHYAVANPYSWPKSSTSLTGKSGTYKYGSSIAFPSSVYGTSNYYVDVTFSPTTAPTTSPTPSQSVTPTITPSPSASPTESPSATPTVTQSPPSSFPDSNSTGYKHTGVTLTTVKAGDSGPGWSAETVGGSPVFYVRSAGAVIDSLNIPMCVKVLANDVTIKRSRIACASYYTVNVSDPPTYYSGLVLTDDEIDGLNDTSNPGIAVMAAGNATLTRLDVHGFGSSGPRLAAGETMQDSYIHGFVCSPPDHSAGTSANDGGSGINILRNNIDISTGKDGCASAAIGIDPDFGQYDGVQIVGNRVAGGAYCIYTDQNQGGKNIHVDNNTFARTYYPNCGQYGPAAQVQAGTNGNTFNGNVYDNGTPIN